MAAFEIPVGIQLYNRPEVANKVLLALKNQSVELDQKNLFIVVDGFNSDHSNQSVHENRTDQVYAIAKKHFPNANLVKLETNLGIGRTLNLLQKTIFSEPKDVKWAIFLEEDSLISEDYCEFMSKFISLVDHFTQIVKISTFQILNYRTLNTITEGKLFAGRGTKAYAERASWYKERAELFENTLDILEDTKISTNAKYVKFAQLGLMMEFLQKDDLLDRILISKNKVHLTLPNNLVVDIGQIGSSGFTEAKFEMGKTKNDFKTLENLYKTLEIQIPDVISQQQQFIYSNLQIIFDGYLTSKNGNRKRNILRKYFSS